MREDWRLRLGARGASQEGKTAIFPSSLPMRPRIAFTSCGLSQLQNWIPHISMYLSMNICLVSANDVMQHYVMEHFLFPGNIKTIPKKIYYLCIAALYINTAVSSKSSITKIYLIADLIFSVLFDVRKQHVYFRSTHNHGRKINSFPRKGQFNQSGNFSTSQGKFNSFKEVSGR